MSSHSPTPWQRLDQRLAARLSPQPLGRFLAANRSLLLWLATAGIIAYGYDLFSFALKIDSENHAFGYGPHVEAWITQGRWGVALLSWLLLPDVITPFLPTLLAVIGMVLGTLFFLHALSERRGFADYLAGALVISCPVLYFAIYFTTLGYGIGAAFFASGLGIYLLGRATVTSRLGAILCFTFAAGIYQATLPMIASLFCLQQVAWLLEGRLDNVAALLRRTAWFVAVLALASLLNVGITRWLLWKMDLRFQSEYLLGFLNFQNHAGYWIPAAKTTLAQAWKYYGGGAEYYLYNLLSLKILFVVGLGISLVRILSAPVHWGLRLLGILLLLAALAAPLVMSLLNNGSMPPRSLLGISFVLAGLVYFTAGSTLFVVRGLMAILAISCFYNFSLVNNRYAFSSEMTWEADRTLTTLLVNDIHRARGDLPPKTDPWSRLPLEIVGWHEYLESPIFMHREVIGASFYTWGAGDAERLVKVFSAMGLTDYRHATQEEQLSVVETAHAMPFWPYPGSVAVVNGVIVVKLREYNPHQLIRICRPPFENHPACIKYRPAL